MHDVLNLRDLLRDEFTQRQEEGYDVSHLEARIRQALYDGSDAECDRLLTLLEKTAQKSDWPYHEPAADLEDILAARSEEVKLPSLALREDELRDRLRGAWLKRACGTMNNQSRSIS